MIESYRTFTALHANSPREAIAQIETMSLMGGLDIPTGLRPFFTPRLQQHGFKLSAETFGESATDITGASRHR